MKHGLVFLSALILDWLWALYIRRSADGRAVSAACFAALLYVLGAYNMVSIVGDWWLAIPASAGAFVGTLVAVRRDRYGKA